MQNISDIGGEFALIDRLLSKVSKTSDDRIKLPIGDDASVIQIGQAYLAVSTDSFLENIHFSWQYFTAQDIGQRAIEATCSDIVAVGGKPQWCWISIAIPKDLSIEKVEELYSGVGKALTRLGASLQGGETVSSISGLSITVTALGLVANQAAIKSRSAAKVGDLVFISGPLGLAQAGLLALQKNISGFTTLKEAHLRPKARIDLVDQLNTANAMIDISDGLASEANHLAKNSKVGIRLFANQLPVTAELKEFCQQQNIDPLDLVLNGGEDFELLYTAPQDLSVKLQGIYIGEVTAGSGVELVKGAEVVPLTSTGYNHFK